jgi:hypothetical protein
MTEPTAQDTHTDPMDAGTATAVDTMPTRTMPAPPPSRFLDEDEYSIEEYEAMLEMYDETMTNIEEGEIVVVITLDKLGTEGVSNV